jgi:endonuclease/exonuclease/phosphatase family metal-dependent hydrolase
MFGASGSPRAAAAAAAASVGSTRTPPLPPVRLWLTEAAASPSAPPPFCAISWNVLMDAPHSFTYLAPAHAAFAHRGPLINEHLFALDADIAGLQEVSRLDSLSAEFSESHAVLFAAKLRSAAVPGDGCALLLRRARFDVLDVQVLHYAAAGATPGAAPLANQVAIIATVFDKAAQRALVVAVTHLKAAQTPAAEAERLAQVEQLAAAVRAAAARAEEHAGGAPVPVLLLGDFNTYPGQRPYFALLTLMPDLVSAYNYLPRSGAPAAYAEGEPAFTTYKFRGAEEKRACEDYIFFSGAKGLSRVALLRLPSAAELGEGRGLPSQVYPSDHLTLGAHLAWGDA